MKSIKNSPLKAEFLCDRAGCVSKAANFSK